MRPLLGALCSVSHALLPCFTLLGAGLCAGAAHAKDDPPPIIGVTAATGLALARGAPAGHAIGAQAVLPRGPWRFAAEAFVASPVTAYTPALGADVGVGLVNQQGLGGALGLYGRRVLAGEGVDPSAQIGGGAMILAKVAPTVLFSTPFVLWVDPAQGTVTPTLAVKLILGVPWAR